MSDAANVLEVRGVSKSFPGVRALHEVDLDLRRGEVLAVIGENGAGKSTLMKILAGIQRPDSGDITVGGKPVTIDSVQEAMDLGIGLIHQELNLADNLSVGANIFLGREPRRFGLIDHQRIATESRRALDLVGLDADPEHVVATLSIGRQQMVEIAKALSSNARILIMDEPTSSLTEQETDQLLDVVDELRRDGVSIIYISHRLREVKRIADRVLVLRDGENAALLEGEAIDIDEMVLRMVGRDVAQLYAREPHDAGEIVLEAKALRTTAHAAHPASFAIRAGEIVGLAGLVGAGRTEMLRALFGLDPLRGGGIEIDGKPVTLHRPADAIRAGVALIPEDRKQQGLIVDMAVRENVSLSSLWGNRLRWGMLDGAREASDSERMISDLGIRTPSAEQIVRFLSGGNQQKVVLGKWLLLEPRVLLLDEPTRGIDVGAKEEIYHLMDRLASRGVAVLFCSSELQEIIGMSDRVLVMHEGSISGELRGDEVTEEAVMQLATGVPQTGAQP